MRSEPYVFALLSDKGWILEKLALDIGREYSNFDCGTRLVGSPDIIYYMTYSSRKIKSDSIEVGYFTHIEEGYPAEQLFYSTAKEVDFCVTQAARYEKILNEIGVGNTITIAPGIDHEEFFPRLKIGVVGRTYHTGRKGEKLVSEIMDTPGIELIFTGDGWPGPVTKVPPGSMGEFYRSLDYVLVPSNYEGGPMCVPEAIACGTPVIAPDVGWVPDFPHISYKKGDANDLRSVMINLFEQKKKVSKFAEEYTSKRWADAHIGLFKRLFIEKSKYSNLVPIVSKKTNDLAGKKISHILHGGEAVSKGGPSTRVPRTSDRLGQVFRSSVVCSNTICSDSDICHIYNIWQPDSALSIKNQANNKNIITVFSPILLDLSLRPFWNDVILDEVSKNNTSSDCFRCVYEKLQIIYERHNSNKKLAMKGYQPTAGFQAKLKSMIYGVDHVVYLSMFEKELSALMGAPPIDSSIVHNPVNSDFFRPILTDSDKDSDKVVGHEVLQALDLAPGDPFLLCVGRIEPRKNQLAMAEVARRLQMPLVIAGHVGSQTYANLVKLAGDGWIRQMGRVSPESVELRWLYRNCAAYISLSWAEGASLASLEAAATGSPLVLSDVSSEKEYFGTLAEFVPPLDINATIVAIENILNNDRKVTSVQQNKIIHDRYNWGFHIEKLRQVYSNLKRAK